MIDHHQASHALMRELLTPESVTSNELHGYIFTWYARFDVVAGILAGNEMVLGREWYIAKEEHDAQQAAMYPGDARLQSSLSLSIVRRSGLDMASLYAKLSRGLISMDDFKTQNELLAQTYERVRRILKSFDHSDSTVTSYPHKEPLTDDDIVDPYVPGGLHHGPSWEINFAWIDYLGTATMFKLQSSLTLGHPPMSELAELAIEQCRMIETIERWPHRENGYMISFKNSLSIAALFLPKDEKHTMWCRRKLALMEQSGYAPPPSPSNNCRTKRNRYIYPPKFRQGLAAVWQMPELNHWWLPHDEGYPDLVREIRAMTEERTNNPRDQFREAVRDMRSVFGKMNLDDTPSETSPASSGQRDT